MRATASPPPAVVGAAALLKRYCPQLGGATIARTLLGTADDRGARGVDQVYGAGVLDIARAMQAQAPAPSFAATRATRARFSALAARSNAITVVDRYGRNFTLHPPAMRGISAARLRHGPRSGSPMRPRPTHGPPRARSASPRSPSRRPRVSA